LLLKERAIPVAGSIPAACAETDTDRAMKTITLLLVDDELQVRRGLRMRLELEPDVQIVGEAGDGSTAVRLAAQLSPSVVLMDVEMPVLDGISAASQIVSHHPATAVVMLSLHDDTATVRRARAAGAADFVSKHKIDDSLLAAIRQAARTEGSTALGDSKTEATNQASERSDD
jgi:DNA-binding NarL/FixJ family response regulator